MNLIHIWFFYIFDLLSFIYINSVCLCPFFVCLQFGSSLRNPRQKANRKFALFARNVSRINRHSIIICFMYAELKINSNARIARTVVNANGIWMYTLCIGIWSRKTPWVLIGALSAIKPTTIGSICYVIWETNVASSRNSNARSVFTDRNIKFTWMNISKEYTRALAKVKV